MKLPEGKSRLDLVKEGAAAELPKRGRFFISITKLIEDERNERKTFRNMEGLIASIKNVGLVEPITVTSQGEDRYRIVTGHRRFRAAKSAGLETVEVIIREPDDENRRRIKSIVSNIQREDVGAVELAEGLRELMDDTAIPTQRRLADIIGKRETWISDMLRILTLPPALQEKLRISEVSIPYDTAMRIARVDDPAVQNELIELALSGAPASEIRERISQIKPAAISSECRTKPKRVFRTGHKATVIVQAETTRLTGDQVTAALKEALQNAKQD